jgi:hypothetical protein
VDRPTFDDGIWSQSLDPLEPDRCERDRCAPCYYAHRKFRGLAGYPISTEDAAFVGLLPAAPSSDGWRYPVFHDVAVNRPELSPADSTMLAASMRVGDVSRSMSAFLAE